MKSHMEQELEAVLAREGDHSDASHDISHMRRVRRTALEIAAMETGANKDVLIAAAYLHDLVNLPKSHPDRAKASTMSAEAARPILTELGMDEDTIAATCHAIEAHSFSAGIAPRTLEARILQDADRLDAIGAIGVARAFYIAAKLGSALFDPEDPFAKTRPLDDKRFALDHFEVKLLRLPEMMTTEGGRAVARQRTDFMRQFLDQLAGELAD